MSRATLAAALAGALGVVGAWEALAALEHGGAAALGSRLLASLRSAGREGRPPTTPERRRLTLVASAALLAAGWLVAGPPVGLLAAALAPWTVSRALRARHRRWRTELERGAPAAARALADALGAGHATRGAVALAGSGLGGAGAAELSRAARELELGERTEVVLERLRQRAASPVWDTVVAAMLLQRRSGGDLAGLLRTIASNHEEAGRLEADARSATAQARFTARLVTLLPVAAAALAELASPGYLRSILGTPLTAAALAAATVCQLLAYVLIRRIARLGTP